MKGDLILRRAVAADIPWIRLFEQGIVRAERAWDDTLADGPVQYYDLERMIGSDQVEMLLASRGRELIGCGFARIDVAKPYLKHRLQGYFGLMYVAPGHRGEGVNQQIIRGLQAWCRARGVTELRLEVYHQNRAAIRAYERAGFKEHLIEMRMSIDEEAGGI